jgi:hypothetical protein
MSNPIQLDKLTQNEKLHILFKLQQEFQNENLQELMYKQAISSTYEFLEKYYGITSAIETINFTDTFSKDKKVFVIDGDVQSGKTKTMLSYCICSILHKRKCIVIVRNFTEDCIQLINAINVMSAAHHKFLTERNLLISRYQAFGVKDVDKWVVSEQYNILVLMANTSQLSHAMKNIVEFEQQFILFVDEADAIMNTIIGKKEMNVYNLMHTINNQSSLAFFISATNYTNWFQSGTSTSRFIKVKPHPDYKGVLDLEIERLPNYTKKKESSIFKHSQSLLHVLLNLTDRPVYDNHPTILLAKCSHLVVHQNEFIRVLSEMVDLNRRWVGIAYNGNGILMYNKFLTHDITFGKFVGVYNGNGTVSFKGMGIMSALSYLKKYWKDKCSRIVIVAGNLANRCINFMDNEYEWHITDEYLDPSETAHCTDLIQSLRICGIHKPKYTTPLKIWCTLNVYENIVNTYTNVGDFIVKAAEKNPNTEFQDMLSNVKIHKDKLGTRKICKVSAPYKKVSTMKQDNTNSFTGEDIEMNYTAGNEEIKFDTGKLYLINYKHLQNTVKQLKLYNDTVNIILEFWGTNKWIERSRLIEKIPGDVNIIKTTFVNFLYKNKNVIVECENEPGLLMKKENNIVYIRLN